MEKRDRVADFIHFCEGMAELAKAEGKRLQARQKHFEATAERVSTMAVGDPQVRPGTIEHSIAREFSQNGYIAGLPLGTFGGTVVRHVFPADAEYKLSGRLVRGVQEGYAGVEGNDTPYTFVITVDGTEVYSAPVGGPKDTEMQGADLAAASSPIVEEPPGRFSTTACCPRISVIREATMRMTTSVEPPGAYGTMMRIGLTG